MPVNLDVIPDKAPDIQRPITVRWVIAGVIILLTGAGLTLWFWQGERTGFIFWFAAICLPVLVWSSLFALRRVGYKLECVAIHSFNREREDVIASETARGQRFAWPVDQYLINALETGVPGNKETQRIALDKSSIITHCLARDGVSTIRHSALPDHGTPQTIFESYASDLRAHAVSMVAQLPAAMPCYVAFDFCENLSELADALYAKIDLPLRRIRDLTGVSILDYWLDRHHDNPAALLILSAQIYELPPQDSGEALTIMLLSNRQIATTSSQAVRIHRPQINRQGTLNHALGRAMLWAKLDATAPLRGWITGGKLASEEGWSNACAALAPKLTTQRSVNIDAVIGYAGAAAPWQSLILAARQCKSDAEPQIIAVESSSSCHQLCAVTSENTLGIV
ncbi:hypothetical protein C3433_05035 [Citrobacter freundii]|nr:hypothetical protein C3433_05035 [Citrobacter freundii]